MAGRGSFQAMLDAATERSRQADMNWGRDPDVFVSGPARHAKRADRPADLPKPSIAPSQPPKPDGWGDW